MSDLGYALSLLVVGAVFAVHCSRATLKEYRNGRALAGIFGDYDRETSPIGFWIVIAANAEAALLGLAFLIGGLLASLE